MIVCIYQLVCNVMIFGIVNIKIWVLEFVQVFSCDIDFLMGWMGFDDMQFQVKMIFVFKEVVLDYVKDYGIEVQVMDLYKCKLNICVCGYGENFVLDRCVFWMY